jgi:tetratricopeptide (TPR) repeat protein
VHWIDTSSDSTTVALPADQPVMRVLLDPRNLVFHATMDEWNKARSLAPFTRGRLLWDHGNALDAEAAFLGGLDSVPVPDLAGLEFLLRLHIGWIAQEAGRLDKAMQEYLKASELAVRPLKMLARLYWNLTKLTKQRGEVKTARWAAAQVLAAEAGTGTESVLTERARKVLEETSSR